MCGITGYISATTSKQELKKAVEILKHRGPDHQSTYIKNNVGLGHSRLSILDLSANANQPVISHSGNNVMVFNGEIYNYKQLKVKYKIPVKTTSDSEVILELFEKKGIDFVNELNGMFAIAIYNIQQKKLYLFRDRLGIKPFYYFYNKKHFFFASEIKALFAFNYVSKNKKINYNNIANFLHLGYLPGNETIFNNIKKLPAGQSFVVDETSFSPQKKYWDINKLIHKNTINNFSQAKNILTEHLFSSVEKRMISDVPLGTFLSGGIDSSLITAIAQSISSKPIDTFSIGFKENKFNETKYARKVAKHLKTNHHEFIVSEKDVISLFDNFFDAYDDLFADSSGFPAMMVSKLAKQHVSVVLSGDGGDELFHGYGMYKWAERLNSTLFKTIKQPLKYTLPLLNNKYKRIAHLFDYNGKNPVMSHIFSQEQYLYSHNEIKKILKISNKEISNFNTIKQNRQLTPAEQQSLFDIQNYLKDDLLVKIDRASMQYALEVRVPLLDHNIVEYAINLHHSLKNKNGETKYLLKEILYDYVPKHIFNRPKWGFSIPLEKWLQTELKFILDKYTSKEITQKYNILNYKYIERLKYRYSKGEKYLFNRLWLIIVLYKNIEKILSD